MLNPMVSFFIMQFRHNVRQKIEKSTFFQSGLILLSGSVYVKCMYIFKKFLEYLNNI